MIRPKNIFNHNQSVFYAISVCMGTFICYCYYQLKNYTSNKTSAPVAIGQIADVLTAGLRVGQTIVINGYLMKVMESNNQVTAQSTVIANENETVRQYVKQSKVNTAVQPTDRSTRQTLSSNWSFA